VAPSWCGGVGAGSLAGAVVVVGVRAQRDACDNRARAV
jgi:hypothetical protein